LFEWLSEKYLQAIKAHVAPYASGEKAALLCHIPSIKPTPTHELNNGISAGLHLIFVIYARGDCTIAGVNPRRAVPRKIVPHV
jgi:hypothetical protein